MVKAEQIRKAIIPVGGLGTRLLPATKALPKELLPVGRRPMVQYVVEEMRAAGLENICFVTGRKKALIQEHFDHDPELVRYLQDKRSDGLLAELAYLESGLHLTYIRQGGPQGVADALSLAEDWVGGSAFVAALGDSIICESDMGALLRSMITEHQKGGIAAVIAVEPNTRDRSRHHSLVVPADSESVTGGAFEVAQIVDKQRASDTKRDWTIAARYVFGPAIFEAIRCTRPARSGELQLVDALRMLLRQGERVRAVCLKPGQRHHDIGNFDGYFRACIEFALADDELGPEMREYVQDCLQRTSACGEDS